MVHAVRANLKDVQREYPRVLLHVKTNAVPPPRGRGASVYKGSVAVSCARVERTVIEERVRQALGAAQPVSVWVAQNASLRLLQIQQTEIHVVSLYENTTNTRAFRATTIARHDLLSRARTMPPRRP